MMNLFGSDQGVRWVTVRNVSGELIPACALMRVTGIDTVNGWFTVDKPNADGQAGLLVNSRNVIEAGLSGQGCRVDPYTIAYDPSVGTPANGETWGAESGGWYAVTGKNGYVIYGSGIHGLANAARSDVNGGGDVPTTGFWAEVTGSAGGPEPDTTYSWKKVVLDPGTDLFVDADPAVTGTNTLKRAPSNVPSPAAGVIPVIPNTQVVRAWPSPTDPGMFECEAAGGLQTVDHTIYTYDWDDVTCVMTPTSYTIRITGRDLTLEVI